jgi:PST family polysaccharide transporter
MARDMEILFSMVCLLATVHWFPGLPRREAGVLPILRFGGTITLNGLVVYLAYNLQKVLLGRYWGAELLDLYGRGYQLVNVPTENLNSAAGGVALAALSRVQHDPERFRNYFLKGYSLILALTISITIVSALFANDLILVLLGPKWHASAIVFRLLAPTIVICGLLGLPYGPTGVALGYSTAMALWLVPHVAGCVHGTPVSLRDLAGVVSRPFLSGSAVAILPAALLLLSYDQAMNPLLRLVAGESLFVIVCLAMLLRPVGDRSLYIDIFRGFLTRATPRAESAEAAG